MNKEQAKKVAEDIFSRYKNEKEVFVTSDGQAFVNEIHAKNHANSKGKGAKLEIFPFQKEDAKAAGNSDTEKTAAQWIELIATFTRAELVQSLIDGEKAGKNRKSIIEAGEKKIAELSKSE